MKLQNTLKIGVVIPIYNVAPYLRECLDSVIAQTYGNFEVCLVNDGSTDILEGKSKSESLKIALEYVAKDRRFVLIDKTNGGQSSARNAGIDYFSKSNSSLGMRFRTCENFGDFADTKSNLNPKNFHKYKTRQSRSFFIQSHTAIRRICERSEATNTSIVIRNANQSAKNLSLRGESQNSPKQSTPNRHTERSEVSKPRESNKIAESMTENRINKSDSPLQHCDSYSLDSRDLDCFDFDKSKSRNDDFVANSSALDSSLRALHFAQNDNEITLYAHPNHPNLTPPKIDYIIFLDSDDFWESDLLESCIKSAQNYNALPDIIWFDWRETYESKTPPNPHSQTMLELFGYANQTQITAIEWLNRAKDRRIYQFWWAWQGLIRFETLQKIHLRFLEGIIFEDNLFGILLFSKCESIAILPRKLYNYRIRRGSTTTTKNAKTLPPFVEPLRGEFGDLAWEYFCLQSLCEMALALDDFCESYANKRVANLCKANFLPHFLAQSCDILRFKRDIYGTKARFVGLLKKERENLQILQIISFITPRTFKGVRYFLFLLCINPRLAIFRAMRKIRKILGLYRG